MAKLYTVFITYSAVHTTSQGAMMESGTYKINLLKK